jgi:hypothetical protein
MNMSIPRIASASFAECPFGANKVAATQQQASEVFVKPRVIRLLANALLGSFQRFVGTAHPAQQVAKH